MAEELLIRSIQEDDIQQVSALMLRAFWLDIAPLLRPLGIATLQIFFSPEALHRRLAQDHFILVAELAQRLLGMVDVRQGKHITSLFVDPPYQRKGVGRALLQAALNCMRQVNPDLQEITVNASPNAVQAYENFGFQPVGDLQERNGVLFIPMHLTPVSSLGAKDSL
jgi:GNAT superfamily N-acetyltransferase